MQDWDTRIKNLKNDIQIAREKYVVPFTKKQVKAPESSSNKTVDENNKLSSVQENMVNHQEKLYVNNDPTQSLDAIGKEEGSEISSKDEKIIGDNDEVAATEEAPTVDINEVAATEEAPTENILEENLQDIGNSSSESQVKKTELELLEERGEDNLSEEEVDRMYELRLLRSQKNMNNELREQEEEELKKADEEIAHLKTLLKPKPKKLPKGYVE